MEMHVLFLPDIHSPMAGYPIIHSHDRLNIGQKEKVNLSQDASCYMDKEPNIVLIKFCQLHLQPHLAPPLCRAPLLKGHCHEIGVEMRP
jgi:hypothetical protein